jgi:hypothetical protein
MKVRVLSELVRRRFPLLFALIALFTAPTVAQAEVISIPSVDFQLECPPCGTNADEFTFDNGLLIPADRSIFYAPIYFPTSSQKVCSFTLIYQDINAGNPLTARMLKKPFPVGGNPTAAPTVMATVVSDDGVVNSIRKKTTKAITQPTIAKNSAFYMAQIDVQTINTNFLGVLVDYRASCPPT